MFNKCGFFYLLVLWYCNGSTTVSNNTGSSDSVVYLPLSEIVYFTEKVTFRPSSGNEMPSSSLCSYFGSHGGFQRPCSPWILPHYFGDLVDYQVCSEICLQKAEADFLLWFQSTVLSNRSVGGNCTRWNGFNWWVTLFSVLFAFLECFHMQREDWISKQEITKINFLFKYIWIHILIVFLFFIAWSCSNSVQAWFSNSPVQLLSCVWLSLSGEKLNSSILILNQAQLPTQRCNV